MKTVQVLESSMNVCFYFSSEIQYNVRVYINGISGLPAISELTNFTSYSPTTTHNNTYECFIEASLFQQGMILGLPVTCSYKQFSSSSCKWNEWITFPVRVSDVSKDTQIVFTIYAVTAGPQGSTKHVIGGVTIPLFEQRLLRFGHVKLRIKEGVHGDGSMDSATLFTKLNRQLTIRDQIQSKITEKAMKQIDKVSYLDPLTHRRLNRIAQEPSTNQQEVQISDSITGIYLDIALPNYGHKVVYLEKNRGPKVHLSRQSAHSSSDLHSKTASPTLNVYGGRMGTNLSSTTPNASSSAIGHTHGHTHGATANSGYPGASGHGHGHGHGHGGGSGDNLSAHSVRNRSRRHPAAQSIESMLLLLNDPELKNTNPVLEKNNKLSQHLDLYSDHDARPTVEEQKRLQEIIKLFDMDSVTETDKQLLWKYRKYLVDDKRALTKFLRIINQSNEHEVEMATALMEKWAPIDIATALELLSGHFICPSFRKYGIDVLRKSASDGDLELYIMQLVQAIRFESWLDKTTLSELERFLLDRCLSADSFSLLNFLYWSVVVASKSEEDDDINTNEKYVFFLQEIHRETKERRADYYEELERQKWLIKELIELSEFVGNVNGKVDDKKQLLRSVFFHLHGNTSQRTE